MDENDLNVVDIEIDYDKPVISKFGTPDSPNLERINAAFAAIDASSKNWNQMAYAIRDYDGDLPEVVVAPIPECGTALCVAGHAVVQAGYYIAFPALTAETTICVDATGQRYDISKLAEHLLGLNTRQAFELFSGNNDRGQLGIIRDWLEQGGRGSFDGSMYDYMERYQNR